MPLVEIRNVRKSFGPIEVLKECQPVGRSRRNRRHHRPLGLGQITMLRCINGLEPIQGGRITVDGIEVGASGTDLNRLRQQVGMVFQSYNLFPHLSVERNITLALTVVQKTAARPRRATSRARWSPRSGWRTSCRPIPTSCRAASSSAWRSPARSPCSRR